MTTICDTFHLPRTRARRADGRALRRGLGFGAVVAVIALAMVATGTRQRPHTQVNGQPDGMWHVIQSPVAAEDIGPGAHMAPLPHGLAPAEIAP